MIEATDYSIHIDHRPAHNPNVRQDVLAVIPYSVGTHTNLIVLTTACGSNFPANDKPGLLLMNRLKDMCDSTKHNYPTDERITEVIDDVNQELSAGAFQYLTSFIVIKLVGRSVKLWCGGKNFAYIYRNGNLKKLNQLDSNYLGDITSIQLYESTTCRGNDVILIINETLAGRLNEAGIQAAISLALKNDLDIAHSLNNYIGTHAINLAAAAIVFKV